jgi:lycopene beta-cyclase
MADVVVAGAGPAGWALASCCARAGLATTLVAPSPGEPWHGTYGLWRDELPDLPDDAIAAAPAHALGIGTSVHLLDRDYLVVDNGGLRRWLTDPGVETVAGRIVGAGGGTVHLSGGGRLSAAVLVNATGGRRAGLGTEQTAYGLIVSASEAKGLVPDDTAVFMDWSRSAQDPSFLYAVPLGGDRVLLEETCLARKPGLALDILAGRLRHRLVKAGILLDGDEEFVRLPLDLPRPRALSFGVAAGMIHPATGYALADSLRLAPAVAAALRDGLRAGAEHAVRAARHEVWPPAARSVHALRRFGLRAIRDMPAAALPEFFELFFQLPTELQRAFTSGRTDVCGTVSAMVALFGSAPWRLRARLAW